MDRRKFVQNSVAGLVGLSSFTTPVDSRGEGPTPPVQDAANYLKTHLPRQSGDQPQAEVEEAKYLVKQFAPGLLGQVILERTPFRVAIAGKVLDFQLQKTGSQQLEGQVGPLAALIHYDYLDDSPALRWTLTLRNESQKPLEDVDITPLWLPLGVDAHRDYPRARHMMGSHHFDATYPPRAFRLGEERFMTHYSCKPVRIASSAKGSAYQDVPVLQFAVGPYGKLAGLFVGFEWSSRWHLEAGWERYSFKEEPRPDFLLEGGVGLEKFRLEPRESLEMPRIHMGFFEGEDWSACDNAVRRYVQEVLSAKLQGRVPVPPVSYDHWFGLHEDFTVNILKREADRAAELGCEYFCLDAAWYPIKKNFGDGLGNWYTPDPRKFPHGIEELSSHVRKLGMGFGIWHDIELAAPGTEVLKRHPDLYLDNPESPRGFKHLRTDLPEGRALALGFLRKWIREWNLTWMRWEYADPQLWAYAVDPSGKLNMVMMRGLYEINDTIRAEFPDLYIEGCQGGSTRMDWGFAVRTHGTWLSDQTINADTCRFMQTGASRFWPAHFLNSAIQVYPDSGDSEVTSRRLLSRMVGTTSFNGDIAVWSPTATEFAKKHVEVYKRIRHLLDQIVVFPLEQPHSDRTWDVVLFGDAAGRKLLLYAFRMEGPDSVLLRVPATAWRQLLGSEKARIVQRDDGMALHLERNSCSLWASGI